MKRVINARRGAFSAASFATLAVGLALVVAGCGSSSSSSSSSSPAAPATTSTAASGGNGSIAVLLPDSKSSVRWETQDRRYLDAAFTAAGIPHTIVNAQGDPAAQRTQADQAITNGAKVLLLVDLDAGSGSAIIAAAKAKGVKVIDYDRLTLGGGANYYVSFNNVTVGKLQGEGLVKCLKSGGVSKPVVAELNGSPTDNNATLFAQGYNSVLDPLYKSGALTKGPNQAVPDWDNQKALTIFEQMLQSTSNKINGVLAANDGLGNAVVSALKARHLKQLPVTGQDATAQGVDNILAGDQCMTVYKAVKREADAASKLAIALSKGQTPTVPQTIDNKGTQTPAVLLTPVPVTKTNIAATVIKDGFLKRSDICQGTYAALCTKAGI
jgi:D-xylose transport system substrate-binding protein